MKKALFSLLVLALIAALLWVNYSGFFLLQGTWVCTSVNAGLLPTGMSDMVLSLAGTMGADIALRFTLGKMTMAVNAFGNRQEREYDYLAQTGRLIFDDLALRFSVKEDVLTLSNTAGVSLVFIKQK